MDWKQIMKEVTVEDEKIALVELEIARLQAQVADMNLPENTGPEARSICRGNTGCVCHPLRGNIGT
jgi:hypothetical protein